MIAPADRRLWLVRHGETEGQSSIRYHGSNDVPLSDVGRAQIRALLPLLAGVAFDAVLHSPQSRARESAELLVDGLGLDRARLRADERLRELSFGRAEGMTRDEIDRAFPTFFADYEADRLDAFPDGESRHAFRRRVEQAVAELVTEPFQDLLLVAHRGTLRHAIGGLVGVPMPERRALGVELASLSVLRHQDGRWQLDAYSLLP
ncbi:MAG: histidine phosphatase family protein [Planctomycetes bacterium]|nr:histidine phosphatase family protein [Planctomycetota bacterium]